uniref:DUF5641 domain-containing protein n=1 Tax=Syphacia muris TaxID=451379 RepID=A0A0N5B1N0_9BILA
MDFLNPVIKYERKKEEVSESPKAIEFEEDASKVCKRWDKVEACVKEIWRSWGQEYLQYMRERRTKNHRQGKHVTLREPEVEEIVLVGEKNVPRQKWKLARITELIRNKKGAVTDAKIRLVRSNLEKPVQYSKRSISQLFPMELRAVQSSQTDVQCRNKADPNLEQERPECVAVMVKALAKNDQNEWTKPNRWTWDFWSPVAESMRRSE